MAQQLKILKKSVKEEDYSKRGRESIGKLLTFVIVVFAAIFVLSIIFRVNNIIVKGNEHYTDDEIIKAIDIEQGDNLFFFDRFATISRVFAKLPYVEQVTVERSLPDKVVITVVECKAMAYLVVGDENWTLDHKCKVLGKATQDELEYLIAIKGVSPGTLFIGEDMTTEDGNNDIVDLLSEILCQIQDRGLSGKIREIDISDLSNITLDYSGKYSLEFGTKSSLDHKFALAVSAISQLMEGDIGTLIISDGSSVHFRPD